MNKKDIVTNSEKETFDLAKSYAHELKGGEVLALTGDLGAGKTVFAQGLGRGLGAKKNISSPTFVIMKVYSLSKDDLSNFCHIDAYRTGSSQEILDIGLNDYLESKDSVVLIEWAEKIQDVLPKKCRKIKIEHLGPSSRKISFR